MLSLRIKTNVFVEIIYVSFIIQVSAIWFKSDQPNYKSERHALNFQDDDSTDGDTKTSPLDLLRTPLIRLRTLVLCLAWLVWHILFA